MSNTRIIPGAMLLQFQQKVNMAEQQQRAKIAQRNASEESNMEEVLKLVNKTCEELGAKTQAYVKVEKLTNTQRERLIKELQQIQGLKVTFSAGPGYDMTGVPFNYIMFELSNFGQPGTGYHY